MSTYGTAVVIDVRPADASRVVAALDPASTFVDVPDGRWVRVTTYLADIEQLDRVSELLAGAGLGRAVIAEDYDEYGALWVVLAATDGAVRTVHRRYVLNADPGSPREVALALQGLDGQDPRRQDVAGLKAATAAATLFEVEPGPMLRAEVDAERAFESIGVVAGPFPWWRALGLAWPGPAAGRPVGA